MRATKVAELLSKEIGVYVTLSRIGKYEERGVLPSPRQVNGKKDYQDNDIERLRKIIIFSEMGVSLDVIRKYIVGVNREEQVKTFKDRIFVIGNMIEVARKLEFETRKGGTSER